jgi:hypothetical protein
MKNRYTLYASRAAWLGYYYQQTATPGRASELSEKATREGLPFPRRKDAEETSRNVCAWAGYAAGLLNKDMKSADIRIVRVKS